MFDAAFRRDPYPLYEQLRRSSPVVHFAPADLWLLLDHADVKRALADHEAFSSAAAGGQPGKWLIFQDPPRHAKLRALIGRAFTARSIAALEPRIRELSAELLDRARERGAMDVVEDFAAPLPLMVIAEMLGAPSVDWPRLRAWSEKLLALALVVSGGPDADRAVREVLAMASDMQSYLDALLAARRAEPRDDLLTRLVEAEVDGERLSDADILGFFQLLLVAGHETTTNLVSNAVLSFIEHPGELARIRAEPALLPSAIEEVLRHRSPVQAVFRKSTRDLEVHGNTIPAGKLVLLMVGAANRDPSVFADPGSFDVGRDPNPHVAFGHGIHFCVGAPLSRLEARVALADFLDRAGDFRLALDTPWEPREAFHVHGPAHLPIRFSPRAR